MNRLVFAFGFVVGAACGGAATYFLLNKKHEKKLNEELSQMLKTLGSDKKTNKEEEPSEEEEEVAEEQPPQVEIKSTTKKPEYNPGNHIDYQQFYRGTRTSSTSAPVRDDRDVVVLIDEDDYGSENDHEIITRYSDGIFADDEFREILDPEGVFGDVVVDHFNGGDADTVWVRNLSRQKDYEIVYEDRTFYDAIPKMYPSD